MRSPAREGRHGGGAAARLLLGRVDAVDLLCVGDEVGEVAGQEEGQDLRATKELDAHERAGNGCVGRGSKDSDEAQCSKELSVLAKRNSADITKGAPMKKMGVTSPPLKPAPSVQVVKMSLIRKLYHMMVC